MELLTKIIDAVFKSEKLSTEKIVFALVIAFMFAFRYVCFCFT